MNIGKQSDTGSICYAVDCPIQLISSFVIKILIFNQSTDQRHSKLICYESLIEGENVIFYK